MKRLIYFLILSLSNLVFAQKSKNIYVIDIRTDIDSYSYEIINEALNQATNSKADIVLFDMNTYGGELEAADKIKSLILNYPKTTWVYVNDNAASAGALISLACDSIYMKPGASIGAATVVDGYDGYALPDKYQSYMRAKMRAVAHTNGRNALLAEAMVDPQVQLPDSIKKDYQVLTLSAKEAYKYGFCDLIVNSKEDIITTNKIIDYKILTYKPTVTQKANSFLMNKVVTAILVILIFIALFTEFATFTGIPSIFLIIFGFLFFYPHYQSGLVQNWEVMTLFVGIVLLLLEIFIIPGFGVVGILGIICILGSFGFMMINNDYLNLDLVSSDALIFTMSIIMSVLLLMGLLFFIFSEKIISNEAFQKLTHKESLKTTNQLTHTHPHTFTHQDMIGKFAIAHTDLRPSGKIIFNDQIYDAITRGDFISKNTEIEVISIFNSSLVVKEKLRG